MYYMQKGVNYFDFFFLGNFLSPKLSYGCSVTTDFHFHDDRRQQSSALFWSHSVQSSMSLSAVFLIPLHLRKHMGCTKALSIPGGPSHSLACVVSAICSNTELLIRGWEPCCNTSVSHFRVFIKALNVAGTQYIFDNNFYYKERVSD